MKKYIMAIDDGTTGIRALIFDHDANLVARAYRHVKQIFPKAGWCEQNAMEVWKKCIEVMKEALNSADVKAGEIEAIGITTQRSTNLLWDKNGKPIYNAITWHDTRTAEICDKMNKNRKMNGMRALGKIFKGISYLMPSMRRMPSMARLITAADISFTPVPSLPKVKWVLDNVEGARKKAEKGELFFGTMDTWLLWNLTGKKQHATDFSNVSATSMYDTFKLKWSSIFLDIFDIPEEILPEVRDTAGDYGVMEKSILGAEIPIASMVADQQASLFAEGCFKEGEIKCTHGTGSFIDMNVGSKPAASLHRLLPMIAWRIKGKTSYLLEGMINTTGAAVEWLKENLGIIKKPEESESIAFSTEAEGVYFVPAFTGLSSPYWDAYAAGIVIGLSRRTRKEHIVRAVLEGIVYRCRDVIEAMKTDAGVEIKSIKADGGASSNNFLLQFMADMLNARVERPKMLDTTGLGAAFLAGIAHDYWKEEDVIQMRKVDKIFEPNIDEEKREKLYNGWKKAVKRALKWQME
ncbi:MAG: glycerol kinase [Thermoplasmata archaeon]|nr:glycerol kinase [Thermoplasmata archaeon]